MDRAVARFVARYREGAALERDRAVAVELGREARPVIEALMDGLASADPADPEAPELREARALASLLGRRVARLGATPTALLGVVPGLVAAVVPEFDGIEGLRPSLTGVCVEGYVAAVEERLEERAAARAAGAIAIVELAARCFAVFVRGDQSADGLERMVDDLGRRLLDRDAVACLVDVTGLAKAEPARARQLFAIDGTCRMLGVRCVFTGVSASWREAGRSAGLELAELDIRDELRAALAVVLDAGQLEIRERSGLWDRLLRSR